VDGGHEEREEEGRDDDLHFDFFLTFFKFFFFFFLIFSLVLSRFVCGGVFDLPLHEGHLALLSRCQSLSRPGPIVLVTIDGEPSILSKPESSQIAPFSERKLAILSHFPTAEVVAMADDDLGRGVVVRDDVVGVVVGQDNAEWLVPRVQRMRAEGGLRDLVVEVVELTRGPSGAKLSSTEARKQKKK
jgi:phosphopantetheine adenylyltransferase